MVTNGRLIWSLSREKRLPGHQLQSRVPRATGGPTWAIVLAAVIGTAITLVLRTHSAALVTLFTPSTIMPAVPYAAVVLLYALVGRRHGGQAGHFSLGRWELPVITGALVWLTYELIVLIGPQVFRDAQYYVLGALGVGTIFYLALWLTEPAAMRAELGARSPDALTAADQAGAGGTSGPSGQPGEVAAPGSVLESR